MNTDGDHANPDIDRRWRRLTQIRPEPGEQKPESKRTFCAEGPISALFPLFPPSAFICVICG